MLKTKLFFCMLFLMAPPAFGKQLNTPEPWQVPDLISSIRINAPLNFCGEPLPLEKQEIRERLENELLLTLGNLPKVILWLKQSGRYLPYIEKMLEQYQMPADLKYIAIIESDLKSYAGSPKGAVGVWQFIKPTGEKYGLKVDPELDQRRNFFASTQAAILYLKELYALFGSWTLAAAAYNMGESGLQVQIQVQKNTNYYELFLPLETQRYVFRIFAAKLVMSDPERYGFRLKKEDLYPPINFDRIKLESSGKIPIQIIAEAANTSFKVIRDLNPEIRGQTLSPGNYDILIPQGAARDFQVRYQKLMDQGLAKSQESIYVVQKGDTLSSIAGRFKVPLQALASWNRLSLSNSIHPGQQLIIYPQNTAPGEKIQK